MPLNAKLLVRSFLVAAVILRVVGGFNFRLSAQELGERLRPDQMADLAAAGARARQLLSRAERNR